jgi:DNA replication and repair protein RecF
LYIEQYSASKLRGINLATLFPSKYVNIIVGNNNAGKTSLIEGIYYCSALKSFKAVPTETLIQNNENSFKLLLKAVKCGDNLDIYTEKSLSSLKIVKVNDKRVTARALLLTLPCIALSFGVENIIIQSSEQRRGFLDWGSFHVEPKHLTNFKNYTKSLKQRNSLLKKSDMTNIDYWTKEVSKHGLLVHEQRNEYFINLNKEFISYTNKLTDFDKSVYDDIKNTKINYYKGWDKSLGLDTALADNLNKDRAIKHTSVGPHRGDLLFSVNGTDLKNISSMSTQIIISLLLVLSQAEVFHVKHGFRPIILIDDLFFGIDDKNLRLVINLLVGSKAQCFITAPDLYKEKIRSLGRTANEVKMYEFIDGEIQEGT